MARPGLTGHRKFRRLARILGSSIVARGALELLWESCYESGDDYVGAADDIETLVGWTGERGLLTRALVEAGAPEGAGFLDLASVTVDSAAPTYRVHDLWHHAPDYVRKRREREIARREKADPTLDRRSAPNGDGSDGMPECLSGDGRTPSPSPSHSPAPSHEKNGSAAPVSVPGPFLIFPTVGDGGPTWQLSEAQVAEWATLFPGIDIRQETRSALAWVTANPGRRKTANGMRRFLTSWLTRATNSRGGRVQAEPRRVVEPRTEGRTCPHTPRCARWKDCTEQLIREGRQERHV
jgi:hypothetical protein